MKKFILGLLLIGLVGVVLPSSATIPVLNATCSSWNPKTFWFGPWGTSGVHKGIDIFARKNTPVLAATSGLVLFAGNVDRIGGKGGNIVITLGPKWRLYYYAHLQSIAPDIGAWVTEGDEIGKLGNTGNARTTPPHLHFEILTLVPYPWRYTSEVHGWAKPFHLNPADSFTACN